jgi:hypothetical protein
MPVAPRIHYSKVDDLYLDPTNPRLGRRVASIKLAQDKVLDAMKDWTLDELATSFLESGFWPQEALIVVREALYGVERLVVVEGNRRLAALKLLKQAFEGASLSSKWRELILGQQLPKKFFDEIPYIEVTSRKEVSAYLGFRHVTGIKEWNPAEKAQYIAKLIEEEDLSYDDVRRKIGSKAPTVRQHYIAYRVLLQMDDHDVIDVDRVEEKFSVLYLSLRTAGAQKFLDINIKASPEEARTPVPFEHLENLANFSKWLFGDKKAEPLFTDSRFVDSFGKILESDDAVEYLERTENPRFELAFRKAGLGEESVLEYIGIAADNVQLALQEAHIHRRSDKVQKAVRRLSADVLQLISIFPAIEEELKKELLGDAGTT